MADPAVPVEPLDIVAIMATIAAYEDVRKRQRQADSMVVEGPLAQTINEFYALANVVPALINAVPALIAEVQRLRAQLAAPAVEFSSRTVDGGATAATGMLTGSGEGTLAVPVDLAALVTKWRERATSLDHYNPEQSDEAYSHDLATSTTFRKCADDLDAALKGSRP